MIGKRGWLVILIFILLASQVVAIPSFYRLFIKLDLGGDKELWRFIDAPSTSGRDYSFYSNGCDLSAIRETTFDVEKKVFVRQNSIINNSDGHNFGEYVDIFSGNSDVDEVIRQNWKSFRNKCYKDDTCIGSCCTLSKSQTEYRPKQELLCGSDNKWYVCDEEGEIAGPFAGGFAAECQDGKWIPIEICNDGLDNDYYDVNKKDGDIDCADPYCSLDGKLGPGGITCVLEENVSKELCNNGVDDDGDGLTDFEEKGCYFNGGCPGGFVQDAINPVDLFNEGDFAAVTDGSDGCCGDDVGEVTIGCSGIPCFGLSENDCLSPCEYTSQASCDAQLQACVNTCPTDCQSNANNNILNFNLPIDVCIGLCQSNCGIQQFCIPGCVPETNQVPCDQITDQTDCEAVNCAWTDSIPINSDLQDLGYVSSNATYFCGKDYDQAGADPFDIGPANEWYWWNAVVDSFIIHTISFD